MKEQNQIHLSHLYSFRIKGKTQKPKYFQVDHYQIRELIGKGGFANVHNAVEIYTKAEVAVKIIDIEGISERDLQHLKREVLIQTQLNHRNIVKIYQTVWTQSKLYIFMELVKGQELFTYLNNRGPLNENAAAKVFGQIVDAVRYMHGLNIAHRDIKTQNIIIDSDFNAKLIDFGLAKIYNSPNDDYLQTFCGSPSYVAPELIQNKRYHGQRVDMWCLGVTLYTMIEACLPFDGLDSRMRQNNICHLNWHKPLYSSRQAIQIYNLIFKKENRRIQIDELLTTQFFSKYRLTQKILFQKKSSSCDYSMHQDFQKVISKTSSLLDIDQQKIRIFIKNKVIGQIYCVFHILWANKRFLDKFQIERKQSKSSQDKIFHPVKRSFHTLQPKSSHKQKLLQSDRTKSIHRSSFIRVLPVINDPHHPIASTPSKPQKKFRKNSKNLELYHEKYHLDLINKEQIAKEAIKSKGQRFKNIFSKDIALKQIKPRLREDSPDSPKRILDCVKKYN